MQTDTNRLLTRKERNRRTRETGRFCFRPGDSYVPASYLKHNIWLTEVDLARTPRIGAEAFFGCVALKQIDLEAVTVIGERAFDQCRHLKTLDLGPDLREMKSGAFHLCTRLRRVTFSKECPLKAVSESAFADCEQLEAVSFPKGVREIRNSAFSRCKALKPPELPLGLRAIGDRAFYSCGFDEIELPEGLIAIGEAAFLKCRNLKYVYVPNSVRRIGKWAFHGCDRLEVLEIDHDPDEIGPWITNKNCTIRCPRGSRMEASARKFGMRVEYL